MSTVADAWRCGKSLDAALPRVSEGQAAVGALMKAANSPHSPRKRWDAQAGRTRPGDSRSQGAGQDAGSGSRAARGVGSPAGSGRAHRGAGRGGRAARPSTAAARRSHTAGEERNAAARHRRRHTGSRRRAGSRESESRADAVCMPPCACSVHAKQSAQSNAPSMRYGLHHVLSLGTHAVGHLGVAHARAHLQCTCSVYVMHTHPPPVRLKVGLG